MSSPTRNHPARNPWANFLPKRTLVMAQVQSLAQPEPQVHAPNPALEDISSIPNLKTTEQRITEQPSQLLNQIAIDLKDCRRCKLCTKRTHIVLGEGNPRADLVFVGEGPGEQEDLLGRPFVGKAGQLLDRMILAIGLNREQVHILNVVKCRPPGNRNPEPDEIEACSPFLYRQLDVIRPKVVVALGKFAAQTLLQTTDRITQMRGKFFTYRGAKLMPTFHPAYLLRNPSAKREAWIDLQQVAAELGLQIPKRGN